MMNTSYTLINRKLQDAVTNAILKQEAGFTKEDVLNTVMRNSVGKNTLFVNYVLIEDYVRNTLEILTIHGLFELKDGVYTKK